MNYSVSWSREAEKSLAKAYLDAREDEMAESFTAASFEAEELLRSDPIGNSESREGMLRVLIVRPATVYFFVDEKISQVTVHNVHYASIRRR